MSKNVALKNKDNNVVIDFTGVDLTLATKIEASVSWGPIVYAINSIDDIAKVIVQSATKLSVNLSDATVPVGFYHLDITYFDENSIDGTLIAGSEVGDIGRVKLNSLPNTLFSWMDADRLYSTPEDDVIFKVNSNTIAGIQDYTQYCQARNLPIGGTSSEKQRELLDAISYMKNIESTFQGERTRSSYFEPALEKTVYSDLPFPRIGMFAYGYLVNSDEMPKNIVDAQCEIASFISGNQALINETSQNIQSEKLAELQITYFKGGSTEVINIRRAMALLKPYMQDRNSVIRG
tara:strand:- start:2749 stop:3624 length:876 start_codon:yes stop_codon:yes gene_type:complete